MGHCSGGTGAEPSDVDGAIERWVERQEPPAFLLGVRNAGGVAGKGFTRPLCQYPQIARYDGTGEPDDAASFSCVDPARAPNLQRPAPNYLR
jgi:feruloyl esterase